MFMFVLLVCAQGLILQTISAQCIGAVNGPWVAPIAAPCETIAPIRLFESAWSIPCGNGFGPSALAASNGAGLVVTSSSPAAPTGVAITSENACEGLLAVSGAIPFLGAVSLEGALPTVGGGAVAYGCGNGNVAILSEEIPPACGSLEVYPGSFAYDFPGAYGFPGPYAINGFGYVRFNCGYNGIFVPLPTLPNPGYAGCSGPWF